MLGRLSNKKFTVHATEDSGGRERWAVSGSHPITRECRSVSKKRLGTFRLRNSKCNSPFTNSTIAAAEKHRKTQRPQPAKHGRQKKWCRTVKEEGQIIRSPILGVNRFTKILSSTLVSKLRRGGNCPRNNHHHVPGERKKRTEAGRPRGGRYGWKGETGER